MEFVSIGTVPLAEEAVYYRERAIAVHGDETRHERVFPIWEWKRLSYVFSRLQPSEHLLEIGPGRGHLTRMLNRSKRFKRISAIDIVERKALPSTVDFRIESVTSIDAEDSSFATVLCMEVLEHLGDDDFAAGLAEIRRVCHGQLVISVPFDESPLPPYHKQSFSEARIHELFPRARKTILRKPGNRTPWIVLEESHRSDAGK